MGVYGRRLVRAASGGPRTEWKLRGTVLITGGTGGYGGHVARWLAGEGAEHLVLVSRRGQDAPGARELAGELMGLGTRVTLVACDVADRDAVAVLLQRYPPDAVVHAAGISGETVSVVDCGLDRFDAVLSAKVGGAMHLDELLGDRPLDAFVLFSSVSGAWGSAGQAAFGAANAYLDALADARRARGRHALSVAWGVWAGSGMIGEGDNEEQLRRRAVLAMDPDLAVTALGEALRRDQTTVVVASVDWSKFAALFTIARPSPLLLGLAEVQQVLAEARVARAADLAVSQALLTRLAGVEPAQARAVLSDLVRAEAAVVLGEQAGLSSSQAFQDAGVDSLAAIDLRDRLIKATGVVLPDTVAFDYPTPDALAGYLYGELLDTFGSVSQVMRKLDEVAAMVMALRGSGVDGERVSARLRTILQTVPDRDLEPEAERPESVTRDNIYDLIDQELG
jgi:NAD(P)-dependent dehydrogenase (short-subunit alcohol dehydrogenase family)/acyl carrier protein